MGNGVPRELAAVPIVSARTSLADVVYQALRDAITSAVLSPGFRLREIALARHFGVSTTPIREALRRLEREGLVEVTPNRGAVVAAYNLRQVTDLYEVREVLECRAIRRAALARGPRDLSRVEALLAEAASVLEAPDQVEFNRLDVELHRALSDVGGNDQLAELAERVHRQIQSVRVRCAVHLPGRPTRSHAEHQAIVAAVEAGDADRAETLVRAHIDGVRDAVTRVLAGQTAEEIA